MTLSEMFSICVEVCGLGRTITAVVLVVLFYAVTLVSVILIAGYGLQNVLELINMVKNGEVE